MFKDSQITQLDAWRSIEQSDALPAVCFPAFVGSGKLGIGLDAAGLQSLPEKLGDHYNCPAVPFHRTQSDLYVLREGMISSHLWDDEIALTQSPEVPEGLARKGSHRNYFPLGWLDQMFEWDGTRMSTGNLQTVPHRHVAKGSEIRRFARMWRRETDLRRGTVRTSYEMGDHRRFKVEIEAFAPVGGETMYLKLTRGAVSGAADELKCDWSIRLNLTTRSRLPIFDQPGTVTPGKRTMLARIDEKSRYTLAEPYAVLYGIAADGAAVSVAEDGWRVTLSGAQARAQTAWLRIDFHRLAGDEIRTADTRRRELEDQLAGFNASAGAKAQRDHVAEMDAFWSRTADVEVDPSDLTEIKRRWLLHMSQYLLRCANEQARGGNVQFLLAHQNGWRACNFHDHHYIIDGVLRSGMTQEAEDHARWMHSVMRESGRPFPWMMTYDGYAPIPPEQDRAPMSDANRALLAIRTYELAGRNRAALLRQTIYPIVRTVAEHALKDWFYDDEKTGRLMFKAVENDVMGDIPHISEAATVVMYATVLRKAIEYADILKIDADRRSAWENIVDRIELERTSDGQRYRAWNNAADDTRGNDFFFLSYYLGEAQAYLDPATFARSKDFGNRTSVCNFAWLNSASASSEIRLGRPDRAEQFMLDSILNTVHGPGYFEEVVPNGISSLPPFGSAHGSYVVAVCEQVVLPDFWTPGISVGVGMPPKRRATRLRFPNHRGPRGLVVSGESDPSHLRVELLHGGEEAMDLRVCLRVPCGLSVHFRVTCDGTEITDYVLDGDCVRTSARLDPGQRRVFDLFE